MDGDEDGGKGPSNGGEDQSNSQRNRRSNPFHPERRLSDTPTGPGAVTIDEEVIEDHLQDNPVYWYGRYRELEKSYKDLASQFQDLKRQQERRDFMGRVSEEDNEVVYTKARNWVGLFSSTLVILNILMISGLFELPQSVLIGAAVAITAIFDAISLPNLVGSVWDRITSIWPRGDGEGEG